MLVKSQVKYIQSLSQKKVRDESGVFVAEGPKIVNELLAGDEARPVAIYATPDWKLPVALNAAMSGFIYEISSADLDRMSFLTTPNQVLGIFRKPDFVSTSQPPAASESNRGITLILDTIQDPGNLGTIIRCADWFGIKRIICSPESADNFSPKVVQSTMASIVRVEVIYTNLFEYLKNNQGLPIYAAALDGRPLNSVKGVKDAILIIGNESKGIRPELLGLATDLITIPRIGKAESLNAAVATGILLATFTAT